MIDIKALKKEIRLLEEYLKASRKLQENYAKQIFVIEDTQRILKNTIEVETSIIREDGYLDQVAGTASYEAHQERDL